MASETTASYICTLPAEVVDKIGSYLLPEDLCSFRLTCKDVERKTLHRFGEVYFRILKTDLSSNSLQRLQAIAQHERYRNHVREFDVLNTDEWQLGEGAGWPRVPAGHDPFYADTSSHVKTQHSRNVQILRASLEKFENCRTFCIYNWADEEEEDEADYLTLTDAVNILLSLVTESDLPVKAFTIEWLVADLCFKPLLNRRYEHTSWEKVEDLDMTFPLTAENILWTKALIRYATGLKKLSLCFELAHLSENLMDDLSVHSGICPELFHGLETLNLSSIFISVGALEAVLFKCRSNLRNLSLTNIHITHGTWISIIAELRQLRCLECIHLARLITGNDGEWFHEYPQDVLFPGYPHYETKHGWQQEAGSWMGIGFHGREGQDKALDYLESLLQSPLNI